MEEPLEAVRSRLRACFPQLDVAQPFLDNAAGSMVPRAVVDAVATVLATRGVCNAMPSYAAGRSQLALKDAARAATALFVNAPVGAAEIVLGPSATALSFRLAAALGRRFVRGDAVVVSGLEHECNASPWRETCAEVRVWAPRWPSGALALEDLAALLADGRVRLLALTAASNAFGLLTPVAAAARAARAAGALVVVDAVHAAPHALPDVVRDELDFLLFSPYKVFAPHLGAMYVRAALVRDLDVPRLHFAPHDAATKFEYGTPPFEALAGWLAALEYLAVDVGGAPRGAPLTRGALERAYAVVAALEAPLAAALVEGLACTPGVVVFGDARTPSERVGTVAFRVRGVAPAVVARRIADEWGVSVAAGHFYATLPCEALGLMPDGVVRASIAHYNSPRDVEALLNAVARIAADAAADDAPPPPLPA